MGGKNPHHLPSPPHGNTSERLPLVGVSLQLTAHSAYGLCCVEWNRLTSGHTSPTSGLNCVLFGKTYAKAFDCVDHNTLWKILK